MNRFDEVVEAIKKGQRFLVVSHVNPEGDAIGSLLGAALALRSLGRDVTAYLEDDIPKVYKFLPGADTVVHSLDGRGPFDVTVAVDCGHRDRLGGDFVALNDPGTLINIDHHATNGRFGDINVVVPDAGAAGELVYDMCVAAGIDITPEIATNLYVAIHTDTGSFRYSSASADSFMKAGELVRLGAKPWEIAKRVYESFPAVKFKLLGLVLPTLDVFSITDDGRGGNVATLTATLDMFRSTGADSDLSDGFVNYARGIDGVEVGLLFRETGEGTYKVSLRSKGEVDVARVAERFGGGGHRNAAGFTIKGSLDEVKRKILETLKETMPLGAG
ncbi:MAG: bifunctional oligoribonuclease/PAP phosphatase NrnA [Thermodesulfobacteriota bacterium]